MTAGLVHEIATEALVDAIVTTGRRLGGSVLRGRRSTEESAIIRWFDTYRLVETPPDLPDPPSPEVLRGDEVQALLHELLAAYRREDSAANRIEEMSSIYHVSAYLLLHGGENDQRASLSKVSGCRPGDAFRSPKPSR